MTLPRHLRLSPPHLLAACVALAAEEAEQAARELGDYVAVAEMARRAPAFWTLAAGTDGFQWDRRW